MVQKIREQGDVTLGGKRGRYPFIQDTLFHIKGSVPFPSYEILHKVYFARKYRGVPLIASSHHEYLDGSGYPRGMLSNEIPFMAKILTVADVYEALTADRHYRQSMTPAQALAILDEGVKNNKFDAGILAALKTYLAQQKPEDAPGSP